MYGEFPLVPKFGLKVYSIYIVLILEKKIPKTSISLSSKLLNTKKITQNAFIITSMAVESSFSK